MVGYLGYLEYLNGCKIIYLGTIKLALVGLTMSNTATNSEWLSYRYARAVALYIRIEIWCVAWSHLQG